MTQTSRSAAIRQLVLANPKATLEEVQATLSERGITDVSQQDVYTARSMIRKKYNVAEPEEVPRKNDGSINVSAVLRDMLRRDPEASLRSTRNSLETDGITFSNSLWHQLQDENQERTPRNTRKKSAKRRSNRTYSDLPFSYGKHPAVRFDNGDSTTSQGEISASKEEIAEKLMSLENTLDLVISEYGDQFGILEDVRIARRRISRALLQVGVD